MKRKLPIWILIVVGAFLACWGLLKKPSKPHFGDPAAAAPQAEKEISRAATVSSDASESTASSPRTFESQKKAFVAAFKTPISFYGRVVDQHGDPVPDADVRLSPNDNAFGRPASDYKRKTDADGRFSITGIGGLTLGVEVSKPGYRQYPPVDGKATSSGVFEYGLSSVGPYQSSKDAPTIFVLYKPGPVEPLVKVGEKSVHMARDGTPIAISLDYQGSSHQVVFRCWSQDKGRPSGQNQFDWRLDITVENGGLVARKDFFDYQAPEEGYLPKDVVDMPASLPFAQWDSVAERSYFIRFDDKTFARATLRMRAGGANFVVWESYYNPMPGSRNLEAGVNQ